MTKYSLYIDITSFFQNLKFFPIFSYISRKTIPISGKYSSFIIIKNVCFMLQTNIIIGYFNSETHLISPRTPASPRMCVSAWALISASWLVEWSHTQQCSEKELCSHWRCSVMWLWKRARPSVSNPQTWHLRGDNRVLQ